MIHTIEHDISKVVEEWQRVKNANTIIPRASCRIFSPDFPMVLLGDVCIYIYFIYIGDPLSSRRTGYIRNVWLMVVRPTVAVVSVQRCCLPFSPLSLLLCLSLLPCGCGCDDDP
jgi:hypothetical protein